MSAFERAEFPVRVASGLSRHGKFGQEQPYALCANFGPPSTMLARSTTVPAAVAACSHVVPPRHIH